MKYKYYARRGTKFEVYFGRAPWAQIDFWTYWFEKLIMRNECLRKEVNHEGQKTN